MRKYTIMIVIIFFILPITSCNKYEKFLSINIIDVGQGDCILISTPDKKNILIDGGDENSEKIIKSYLKKYNIKKLDIVIATHFDRDHIGGLDYIINKFSIGKVYVPNTTYDSESYINLINSCKDKDLPLNNLKSGDTILISKDISFLVLSPSIIQDNNNSNSIVINLSYNSMDFLFTGDCENDNEIDMIERYNLENIDFLKVAHHGSNSSSSDDFVKEISPDIAAISCGYKNQYGHPHKSTLDTLNKYNVQTFRTDINGDLIFYSDGHKIFTNKKYK